MWKTKELIRNLQTGNLYLVLQVIPNTATIITELTDSASLPLIHTLLPREYHRFARDNDIIIKNGKYRVERISL